MMCLMLVVVEFDAFDVRVIELIVQVMSMYSLLYKFVY